MGESEAVTCGEVVCGVMFVSLSICTCYCHSSYFALDMAVAQSEYLMVLIACCILCPLQ